MKGAILSFVLTLLFTASASGLERQHDVRVPLADPFILLDSDTYYAYGTGVANGIEVWTSNDLAIWDRAEGRAAEGLALHKDDVWGDKWFWAPEVYRINERYYMFFSAEEHICVAVADSPLGPFRQNEQRPMIDGEKCIDNTLFIDDGRAYMFFDRFDDGLNICMVELTDDLLNIKPETMRRCIHVSQEWEEVWPRVNEGCFVVKHNGTYYMTYSANSYESQFYGIGFATADSLEDKWVKSVRNPILQKPRGLVGVGHSAMFRDKNGNLKIVFHAHCDSEHIHPRHMYIASVEFIDGIISIDENYSVPCKK